MDDYMGSIMGWGPPWALRGWGLCAGQLLPIAQYNALFSLLGTLYGGDGRTTFGLPDLQGRRPISGGYGPGLSPYTTGAQGGQEYVTLTQLEMPQHNHSVTMTGMTGALVAATAPATEDAPDTSNVPATGRVGLDPLNLYTSTSNGPFTPLGEVAVAGNMTALNSGGSQSHENRPPFQVINFVICMYGLYPSRN